MYRCQSPKTPNSKPAVCCVPNTHLNLMWFDFIQVPFPHSYSRSVDSPSICDDTICVYASEFYDFSLSHSIARLPWNSLSVSATCIDASCDGFDDLPALPISVPQASHTTDLLPDSPPVVNLSASSFALCPADIWASITTHAAAMLCYVVLCCNACKHNKHVRAVSVRLPGEALEAF